MSKRKWRFKKGLERTIALFMVLLLISTTIFANSVDALVEQPNNSNDIYIAISGVENEGEFDYTYDTDDTDYADVTEAPDEEIDNNDYTDNEYSYGDNGDDAYKENEVEKEIPAYVVSTEIDINAFDTTMPVPFGTPVVQVDTWDMLNAQVQAHVRDSVFIQITGDIMATDSIWIPVNTTVFLGSASNVFSIYQHTAEQRHFVISGGTLYLDNVHLTRSLSADDTTLSGGIAVENGGSLYMFSGSVVSNNRAWNGGGICVYNGSTFVMTEGIVENNISINDGGGVRVAYGSSTFAMSGGRIEGNRTLTYSGGGINVHDDAHFQMSGTAVIYGNHAAAGGGGLSIARATAEMTNGTIENNTAANNGGGVGMGGTHGSFTMQNGLITGNRAYGLLAGHGMGGGIESIGSNSITVNGGIIEGNTAIFGGGIGGVGATDITINNNTIIRGNTATYGGGIYARGGGAGVLTINSGTIGGLYANTATRFGGGVFAGNRTFNMNGGTIQANAANIGGGIAADGATFTMTNGSIESNTATTSGGGVYAMNGAYIILRDGTIRDNSAVYGGGLYVLNGSEVTILGGNIEGNQASSNGGGVVINRGAAVNPPSRLFMHGGVISNNSASNHAGGVRNVMGEVVMTGGVIENNTANIAGGVDTEAWASQGSPALFTMRMPVNGEFGFEESNHQSPVIRNNEAVIGGGGGVLIHGGLAEFIMSAGTIKSNTALSGGGVHVNGIFTMTGGSIEDNTAINGGGVFVNAGGTFTMNGAYAVISGNTAADGGGVLVDGDSSIFTMNSGKIVGNEATFSPPGSGAHPQRGGGGVRLSNHAVFIMNDNSVIENNISNSYGGGVSVVGEGSHFIMNSGTITNNNPVQIDDYGNEIPLTNAIGAGGVAVADNASFTMHNGEISNNRAWIVGGVSTDGEHGTFTMHNGMITYNESINHGGGVRAQNGSTFIMYDGVILGNKTLRGNGGGVILDSANSNVTRFLMHGGTISGNFAAHNSDGVFGGGSGHGGGVRVARTSEFVMTGGTIEGNESRVGGGVNIEGNGFEYGTFIMRMPQNGEPGYGDPLHQPPTIQYNDAFQYGGGVHLQNIDTIFTATAGRIVNNHANRDGGGIWTVAHDYNRTLSANAYSNLTIADTVVFAGNTAGNGAYLPPTNPEITDIALPATGNGPSVGVPGLLATPPMRHTLNNYDINFTYPNPAVEITKSAPATVTPNSALVYTITVRNTGNVTLTDLVVTDNLPVQLVNPRNLQYPTGVTAGFTGQVLNATIASLAPRASVTITFTVTVNAAVGTAITNTATVNVPSIPGVNDEDSSTTTVVETPAPAVQITKSAPATVQPNSPLTYTITVRNTGNVTLTDLAVADNLPAQLENPRNLQYPTGVTAGFTGQVLNATIASLAPGDYVTITFTVTVNAAVGTAITNTATVDVPSIPGVGGDDSSTTTVVQPPGGGGGGNSGGTDPTPNPAVQITKSAPATVQPNSPLTYTITVRNTGNVTLTDLVVTDNLPAQLENPRNLQYPTGVTAGFTGQVLNATIASLAPGASVTITFTVTVNAAVGTAITNTATVDVPSIPGVGGDDSSTTTVVQPPGGGGGDGGNGGGNWWTPGQPSPTPAPPQEPNAPGAAEALPNVQAPTDGYNQQAYETTYETDNNATTNHATTTDTDDTTITTGRKNPQTGDDFNRVATIVSLAGLAL